MKINKLFSPIKVCTLLFGITLLTAGCKKDEESQPMEDNVNFTNVSLSSGQEVPSNNSSATGSFAGKYDKNSNTLSYTITYAGLTPSGMHFHKGAVGVAGGVEMEVKGPYSSGMTGSVKLTDIQEQDLLKGLWYLNIHSAAVAAGEIRGQIVTDNMVVLSNIGLNGKQEVPMNNSTATGTFNGWYDKTTKMLTYTVTLNGVTSAGMHIHKGAVGVAGDVVTEIKAAGGTTAALTAAQEADLLAGNLYVNVHSTAFPGGEVRGQIVSDNQVVFANEISANNEVPASGSTATGAFYGIYDRPSKKLSYTINFDGTTPTSMHLHKGAAGENGGVEMEVTGPYTSGMKGSVMLNATQETYLLNSMLYLNVHSELYPGGEIRAQLVK